MAGRAALNAGRIQDAVAVARDAQRLVTPQATQFEVAKEPHLATALGTVIEVLAETVEKQGRHAGAVRLMNREFAKFHASPIGIRIRTNLLLLTIDGQLAPKLETRQWLGPRPPSLANLRGQPILLFFRAHYYEDSRAEGRILSRIRKQFDPGTLALIGPTRLYGHLDEHRRKPAGAIEETQRIKHVFRKYYQGLSEMPIIIDQRNFVTYGASTTLTRVLVDRGGLVSLCHPGKMPYRDLTRRVTELIHGSAAEA